MPWGKIKFFKDTKFLIAHWQEDLECWALQISTTINLSVNQNLFPSAGGSNYFLNEGRYWNADAPCFWLCVKTRGFERFFFLISPFLYFTVTWGLNSHICNHITTLDKPHPLCHYLSVSLTLIYGCSLTHKSVGDVETVPCQWLVFPLCTMMSEWAWRVWWGLVVKASHTKEAVTTTPPNEWHPSSLIASNPCSYTDN